jgi:hypothetical protein
VAKNPTTSTTRLVKSSPGRTVAPLPNFLIIGAMKAGTTSLYHYLRVHPHVFMASIKELDFFDRKANWKRGLDWYRKQFEGAGPEAFAVGEASTAYTKYPSVPGVPERMATVVPEARLIYVVRNPIDRIRSHYQHRVAVGAEKESFEKAVFDNPIYLHCSRYASQVEQYLHFFSREKLLLITSEELRHSREPTMRRVYAFLGLDSNYVPEILNHEFLRTDERATYPPAAGIVRRAMKRHFPSSKKAKEFVDSILPQSLDRVLGRRNGRGRNSLDPIVENVRCELTGLLRDDVAGLRSYMAEGFDGWGIA